MPLTPRPQQTLGLAEILLGFRRELFRRELPEPDTDECNHPGNLTWSLV